MDEQKFVKPLRVIELNRCDNSIESDGFASVCKFKSFTKFTKLDKSAMDTISISYNVCLFGVKELWRNKAAIF